MQNHFSKTYYSLPPPVTAENANRPYPDRIISRFLSFGVPRVLGISLTETYHRKKYKSDIPSDCFSHPVVFQ